MKKIYFVVFLLLPAQLLFATQIDQQLQSIEREWARAYYSYSQKEQAATYQTLLQQIRTLDQKHPNTAETKILQAVIVSTNAGLQDGFSALDSIYQAKELLTKAIEINPTAFEGSAYVNLGTLYYMAPGWPIAFGNNEKAQKLLLTALKLNPNGIDSNYFYGDYLLSRNQPELAIKYFHKALQGKIRPEQAFADKQLKLEVKATLENTKRRKLGKVKNKFFSLFNTAQAD